jgi:phosphotransferase system HPr-like phosphotransfer protein
MLNKIILRELESKSTEHKLFIHQNSSDLKELVKIFNNKNELLINFDIKEWDKVFNTIHRIDNEEEKLFRCQEYIALKILEQLQKNNSDLNDLDIKKQLNAFKSNNELEYQKIKDKLFNTKDIIDILSLDDYKVDRLHFVMNGNKSITLCDSLCPYLEDALPFSTTIYTSPNTFYTAKIPFDKKNRWLWNACKYVRFDEFSEGVENIPKEMTPKRKVKA